MSQTIDPNVANWNVNYQNDPLPPDLKALLDHKAATDGQLANTPSSHPTFAALTAKQATLATAIQNHPKRAK